MGTGRTAGAVVLSPGDARRVAVWARTPAWIRSYWPMARQPDIPHEALDLDTVNSRSYALARFLSRLFNPIYVNIASFLIVGAAALSSPADGLKWAALCVLVFIVPPTTFYYVRLRHGAYSDEDVSVRQQRNEL